MKKQRTIFHRTNTAGFSFVEMIVVVGIGALLAAAMIGAYTRSGPKLVLQNSANDLVARVREAQASAMAVARHPGGTFPSWGIFIDLANPTQTILYGDLDLSGTYKQSDTATCGQAGSECVKVYPLARGIKIVSLCGAFNDKSKAAVPGSCSADSTSNYFDIFFKRPFADIALTGDPGDGSGATAYRTSTITLQTTKGDKRQVLINYASEMTVK